MSPAANQLLRRVIGWQIVFAVGAALIMGLGAQHLLLLSGSIGFEGAWQAATSIIIGAALGMGYSAWLLKARRFTLRYLAMGSGLSDTTHLEHLSKDPRRIAWGWFIPITTGLLIATTVARPLGMDVNTGFTLFLLGSVIVAATSLPLMVLVRAAYLKAIELAPVEVMGSVVKAAEEGGEIRRTLQLPRRLVAAVTTPVLIVALGSALIANAHVRRNDERNREESAGALARAVLELDSGSTNGPGLSAAIAAAERLGFSASLKREPDGYRVERMADGLVELTTPLDAGSAQVRFNGSTIAVLSADLMLIASLAVLIAGTLGVWLGRVLIYDLRVVTRSVRALGTEAVIRGTRQLRPARFYIVAQLALAIDRLAARFRVFARAQERAIQARQAAARARGMFFASVSHDLKSPLNAILGFTELVRLREDITPGQSESLELIQRRGRELLALIETILDAARVEAGQLTLNTVPYSVSELVRQAALKAYDLAAEGGAHKTLQDVSESGNVLIDPDRMPGALATFIAHGIRTAEKQEQRVRAFRTTDSQVQVEVEVPTTTATAAQLEAMLDPTRQPGAGQHRGLALGLRLARSVVELHKGSVSVKTYEGGLLYIVKLPAAAEELRNSGPRAAPVPEPSAEA